MPVKGLWAKPEKTANKSYLSMACLIFFDHEGMMKTIEQRYNILDQGFDALVEAFGIASISLISP